MEEEGPNQGPPDPSASREASSQLTRSLLLLIPTHIGHLEVTLRLVSSIFDRITDAEVASMRLVVSGAFERQHFEQPISWKAGCSPGIQTRQSMTSR